MKPVSFSCRATLPQAPEAIAAMILDVSQWPNFDGYGPLPGIASAEFEVRTPEVVGSRIRVVNRDGSKHFEEIAVWAPARRLQLVMKEFSPPLSRLAARFVETWDFERAGNVTNVVRTFEMHAASFATRPVLWLISFLLKRAVARHLQSIAAVPVAAAEGK